MPRGPNIVFILMDNVGLGEAYFDRSCPLPDFEGM
jgi:hypothetical protein